VVAVDVGYGQLDLRLRDDRRVRLLERTNIRALRLADVGGDAFDVVVADLSFISLERVAPVLCGDLARPGAALVVLVKPQFEVGRAEAARARGVIRDPGLRQQALRRAASAFASQGATIMGAMASPVLGPAGNAEFLLHARAHDSPAGSSALPAVVCDWLDDAVDSAPDAATIDAGGR
jgi:23S rRNA (cytidine1920-2'-O)/16S rRNA (cytidine1409-2'-O)-methyltransferase